MVSLDGMYQALRRGDPGAVHDGEEALREHAARQLQGQEGDPRL